MSARLHSEGENLQDGERVAGDQRDRQGSAPVILHFGRNSHLLSIRSKILQLSGQPVDHRLGIEEADALLGWHPQGLVVLCHSLSDADRAEILSRVQQRQPAFKGYRWRRARTLRRWGTQSARLRAQRRLSAKFSGFLRNRWVPASIAASQPNGSGDPALTRLTHKTNLCRACSSPCGDSNRAHRPSTRRVLALPTLALPRLQRPGPVRESRYSRLP